MIQHPSDLRRAADHAGRSTANHAVRIIWLCAGIARELIRSRAFDRAAEVIATLADTYLQQQDWSRAYQVRVVAALEFELYDNKLVWLLEQRQAEQGSSAA